MKRIIKLSALLAAMFILPPSLIAQDPMFIDANGKNHPLPPKFVAREKNAPAGIKTLLSTQRKQVNDQKLEFHVGFTGVSNKSLAQITGEQEMSEAENTRIKQYVLARKLSPAAIEIIKIRFIGCMAGSKKYDARTQGYVTPIRDQQCGNCWAYSAVGAYEGSYKKVNGSFINASEQQAVNCVDGSCGGGFAYKVMEWMVDLNKNLATETAIPDAGVDQACAGGVPPTNYYATDWGVVHPSGDPGKIASVADIKEAMCKYGPIAASVQVTSLFQNYAGGVFNEFPSNYASPSSNHAIVLVGWDDDKGAWLMKNSWGTDWGEDGYMWIKYGTNNIGRRAAWIIAKKAPAKVLKAIKTTDVPVIRQQ
ncbi:MAG: C1 family peptidase [Bacteroidota bacterium]